jgi:RNA polymerase primary sigma factor
MSSMTRWEAQYQGLQQYRREVEALPKISEEEALVLIQQVIRARAGEYCSEEDRAVRNRLIEESLHLVLAIAPRYASQRVDLLDLVQEGNLGLLCAIDTCSGIKESYTAYISNVIRHAISAAMDNALPIRIPRSTLQKARKQQAASELYEMQPLSLDMPLRDQPECCFGDLLEAPAERASLSPEEAEQLRHQVEQLLDPLPEQERRALQLHFGLDEDDQHEHSFEEIAAKLGIHESTARAVIARGLLMLKGQRETPQLREARQAKEREARLESAYAELQGADVPITEERLAQAAHVHIRAAAAYLRAHGDTDTLQQQQRARRRQANDQTRRERLATAYARLLQQEEIISAELLAEQAQVSKNVACTYLREQGHGTTITGMTPRTYRKLLHAYQQLQADPSARMSVQRLAQTAGVKWQAAFRFLSVQHQAQSQEEKVAV